MKQVIKDILEDVASTQVNLESGAAREMIANLIVASIKSKGGRVFYGKLTTADEHNKSNDVDDRLVKKTAAGWAKIYDIHEEEIEQKKWVCGICNESTWEVDWDYVGSGTNHLECELKLEMKNKHD